MARFVRLGLRATVIARTSPRLPPTEDKAFPFARLVPMPARFDGPVWRGEEAMSGPARP